MHKTDRMIRLTVRLLRGETITAPMVAREYGISYRTAKRDLTDLELNLPLYRDRGRLTLMETAR